MTKNRIALVLTTALAAGAAFAVTAPAETAEAARRARTYSITGTVWNDTDKDGRLDKRETRTSGKTITVKNAKGRTVKVVKTSSKGQYRITGLAKGTYTVTTSLSGYAGTTVAGTKKKVSTTGTTRTVKVTVKKNVTVNFGLIKAAAKKAPAGTASTTTTATTGPIKTITNIDYGNYPVRRAGESATDYAYGTCAEGTDTRTIVPGTGSWKPQARQIFNRINCFRLSQGVAYLKAASDEDMRDAQAIADTGSWDAGQAVIARGGARVTLTNVFPGLWSYHVEHIVSSQTGKNVEAASTSRLGVAMANDPENPGMLVATFVVF